MLGAVGKVQEQFRIFRKVASLVQKQGAERSAEFAASRFEGSHKGNAFIGKGRAQAVQNACLACAFNAFKGDKHGRILSFVFGFPVSRQEFAPQIPAERFTRFLRELFYP
jgi:hypothetical protein